jgi:hypothetical protein
MCPKHILEMNSIGSICDWEWRLGPTIKNMFDCNMAGIKCRREIHGHDL